MKPRDASYTRLLNRIDESVSEARGQAVLAVNTALVKANWNIGRHLVEFEQDGKQKAEYGSALLDKLVFDLKRRKLKGYSKSTLYMCRQFYLLYPNFQTLSGKLTWSHYTELIAISNPIAREFYEQQVVKEQWSIRVLQRQVSSALFERLALSRDKEVVMEHAQKGVKSNSRTLAIKDPYIFEFLGLAPEKVLTEKGLEKRIIDCLQQFLLELGQGFTFVARQYPIVIDNIHYYIDLLLYHRILHCFVIIDLKTRKVRPQDIGQMNLYINYFREEENTQVGQDPIGIIIAADKQELMVKYATGGLTNRIFVSKYQSICLTRRRLKTRSKSYWIRRCKPMPRSARAYGVGGA